LAQGHLRGAFFARDSLIQHAGCRTAGDDDVSRTAAFHDPVVGFQAETGAHFAGVVAAEAVTGEDGADVFFVVGVVSGLG
jgi:hypothetical protein